MKSQCKECGGASICPHGRLKSRCKECGGERKEPVNPAAAERRKRQLKRVKEEEADDERVGPEPNAGINELSAFLKKKKQRRS